MAGRDYKALLQKMLTVFSPEEKPLRSLLEWLVGDLMKMEDVAKVGCGDAYEQPG